MTEFGVCDRSRVMSPKSLTGYDFDPCAAVALFGPLLACLVIEYELMELPALQRREDHLSCRSEGGVSRKASSFSSSRDVAFSNWVTISPECWVFDMILNGSMTPLTGR